MRQIYHEILKKKFYDQVIHTRDDKRMTQAEMAERLAMADRSYIELDHGNYSCSAVTLALYLCYLCDDAQGFLDDLRKDFDAATK